MSDKLKEVISKLKKEEEPREEEEEKEIVHKEEAESKEQKVSAEISILQNDGVFRYELLIHLTEISESLKTLSDKITKLINE